MHFKTSDICKYVHGRHIHNCTGHNVLHLNSTDDIGSGDGFIMKFKNTPWPEVIDRKIAVGRQLPKIDVERKLGVHVYNILK